MTMKQIKYLNIAGQEIRLTAVDHDLNRHEYTNSGANVIEYVGNFVRYEVSIYTNKKLANGYVYPTRGNYSVSTGPTIPQRYPHQYSVPTSGYYAFNINASFDNLKDAAQWFNVNAKQFIIQTEFRKIMQLKKLKTTKLGNLILG